MEIKTPRILYSALIWLDKMNIPHCFLKESNVWEIHYKGHYILMPNFTEDDEIALIYPVFIKGEDKEIQDMVYEFALSIQGEELRECNIDKIDNDLCQVSQLWKFHGVRKIYKYQLVDILNRIVKCGEYFELSLQESYEMLFNPPPEVLEEILRSVK